MKKKINWLYNFGGVGGGGAIDVFTQRFLLESSFFTPHSGNFVKFVRLEFCQFC